MNLVPFSDHDLSSIPGWISAGRCLIVPGSAPSGYIGWGYIVLTPSVLAVLSPEGVEEAIPLIGIEDVTIVKLEGLLVEYPTSVGPLLAPLPYPHGIDVLYSEETRLKLRVRVATLAANAATIWAADIRSAAHAAQRSLLSGLMPHKRQPDTK